MATVPLMPGKPLGAVLAIAILLLPVPPLSAANQSSGKTGSPLQWPSPPAAARIYYTNSWYGEQSILGKQKRGLLKRLGALIFGQRERHRFIRPFGISVSRNGTVAVTDPGLKGIHIIRKSNRSYRVIRSSDNEMRLDTPIGVAFNTEKTILVTDSKNAVIFEFSLDGETLRHFGGGLLKRPTAIAVHPIDRRIFVVDTSSHQIAIFSPAGKLLDRLGKRGKKAGAFNYPTHITFDEKGNLYVVDSMNFRVQVFDRELSLITKFGRHGDRLGEFSKPKGIAVDRDGYIYVIESFYDHLLVFDNKGRFMLPVGGNGDQPGKFNLPAGVAVHGDQIYVADSYNRRIQIFRMASKQQDGSKKSDGPEQEQRR